MAHDHRMNPVGEPHLNRVRKEPQGRSDLPRLRANLTKQVYVGMGPATQGVFSPSEDMIGDIVSSRLKNYRLDRNDAREQGRPLDSLTKDTAQTLKSYINSRIWYR